MEQALPDRADREAAKTGSDQVIVVEAAAGTGKTTLLVDRILHILLHERHPVTKERASLRDIAAITFTEKAAAEMRERLRDRIEKQLREECPREERESLQQAITDLDSAQITTIHSFCAALLRECPVEAELDPETAVADAIVQGILVEEAFERWLERMLADQGPLEENPVALFLEEGSTIGRRGSDSSRSLRGIARRLIENRELLPYLEPVPEDFGEALEELAGEFLAEVEEVLSLCGKSKRGNKTREFLERFQEIMHERGTGGAEQVRDELQELVDTDHHSKAEKLWGGVENLARAVELCKRIKFAASLALKAKKVNRLANEMKKLVTEYEGLKRQRRQLDFLDLLLKADALVAISHMRDYIAARYPFLLIDEFQDTDPIQAKLVQSLLGAQSVRPKLFIVGDPKQSIYRFRRADIETYSATLEALSRDYGARKLYLSCNFRSVPAILRFVNHVCEPLIRRPEDGAYQPDYVPLQPPPNACDLERPAIHYLKPPSSICKDKDAGEGGEGGAPLRRGDIREMEGYVVGQFLQRVCASGWEIREGEGRRPIRLDDMAILFERTTGLGSYEVGLQAAGLRYRIIGGKTFYTRIEIKSVLAVLRALENPMSELRVVAALRTPIFGLSDEDLVEHRIAKGLTFNYLTCSSDDSPLCRAFDVLRRLYKRREKRPVYRVIEQLYDETGAVELFASLPDGADRASNLLHLLDMCRRLEAAEPQTFRTLVEWLESMASETEEETEVPVAELTGGAVQILTIHRSKGLEFPLVVIGEFGCPRQIRIDPPLVDRSDPSRPRIGLSFSQTLATPGWLDMREKEKKRLHAERVRLLYVALTRARDYLVLPVSWPYRDREAGQDYSLEELIADYLDRDSTEPCPSVPVQVHNTDEWGTFTSVAPNPRIDPLKFQQETTQRAVNRLLAEAEAVERHLNTARDQSRHGLRILRPSEEVEEYVVLGYGEDRGESERPRDVGVAVHQVLEALVSMRQAQADETSREAIQTVCERLRIEDSIRGEVLAHIERTIQSQDFQSLIRSARRLMCEVPLAGPGADRTELVEGVADLLVETEDGWTVVDYKTDRIKPGEEGGLVERYGRQVRAYVKVLQQALGRDVRIDAQILATSTGKLVPVPLD